MLVNKADGVGTAVETLNLIHSDVKNLKEQVARLATIIESVYDPRLIAAEARFESELQALRQAGTHSDNDDDDFDLDFTYILED